MFQLKCEQTLKEYWGYDSFRLKQWEVIEQVLNKQDAIVLFPTGGGKSICYQIPGLINPGLCLVISPLISLMKDQVDELLSRNITARFLSSDTHLNDRIAIWNSAQKGTLKFLFLSPESLSNPNIIAELNATHINLVAIDEAHCISEWGHDFRPSYLSIHESLNQLSPKIPRIALTATATPKVLEEIGHKLDLRYPVTFQSSFKRKNLAYFVIKNPNSFPIIERIIKKNKGSGIIYANSRNKCHQIESWLSSKKIQAKAYHAGLNAEQRTDVQNKWKHGEVPIVVATNAFGMGINKEDVRWVIHIDPPQNCEAYFQEAGRAGRDGNKAFAVLFATNERAEWLTNQEKNLLTQDKLKHFVSAFYTHFHIPLNQGDGKKYILNFDEFYKKRKISKSQTKRYLEHLKHHEFLSYTNFDKGELYFRFKKIEFNPDYFNDQQDVLFDLFELLIRKYTHKHFEYIPIDSSFIASKLRLYPEKVIRLFEQLQTLKLIEVRKKDDCIVQLKMNRAKQQNSFLGLEKLDQINDNKIQQAYSMQKYVQNTEFCRTAWMMNYFNENNNFECGICDICVEKKSDPIDRKKIKQALEIYLSEPIDIQDLLAEFKPENHTWIKTYLNQLALNEKIEIKNQFIYPIK